MAHLLLDSDLSGEQRRYAEVVHNSAETLKSLLDHVLDLSKIEAGKATLECLDFDLRGVMEGVVEMLAIGANSKGLELTCLVAPGTASLLRGDAGRLRQIVSNLVANAIKFTEAGRRRRAHGHAPVHDQRHGHWDPKGPGRITLLALRASRSIDDAQVWRHRLGADDFEAPGGDDGRPDRLR
jgi:signal transduction histidine kinase